MDGAIREDKMRILGTILILVGLLLCFTLVGAIFGIPMMIAGCILVGVGGRRKVVINNTVTVSNAVPAGASPPENYPSVRRDRVVEPPLPRLGSTTASLPPPVDTFDRKRWLSLIRYDEELRSAAETVRVYGSKWEDELAEDYLRINDRTYLPKIVERIVSEAQATTPLRT